jgi:uroporphyrinogen III methyltransferase / synthase
VGASLYDLLLVRQATNSPDPFVERAAELGYRAYLFSPHELFASSTRAELTQVLSANSGWFVFTSPNGVRFTCETCPDAARYLAASNVAAIGPATANALQAYGISARLVARDSSSAGLADEFASAFAQSEDLNKKLVLLRGSNASTELAGKLSASGFILAEHQVYEARAKTIPPEQLAELKSWILGASPPQAIAITSSQNAETFLTALFGVSLLFQPEKINSEVRVKLTKIPVFALGPKTGERCQQLGLNVVLISSFPGVGELADAVCRFLTLDR